MTESQQRQPAAMIEIEIHYSGGEWAALYVNGELVTVTNSYRVEERAFKLLGVRRVLDDAFMRGQDQRDGTARNLAEVAAYRKLRDERKAEVGRLRAEAQQLLEKAATLDGEISRG